MFSGWGLFGVFCGYVCGFLGVCWAYGLICLWEFCVVGHCWFVFVYCLRLCGCLTCSVLDLRVLVCVVVCCSC